MPRPILGRRARAHGAVAVLLAVSLLQAQSVDSATGAQIIGRLPRYPEEVLSRYPHLAGTAHMKSAGTSSADDGNIVLMPRQNRLFQLWPADRSEPSTVWLARDLDTLRIVRIGDLPGRAMLPKNDEGADLVHAVDERRGRLFLAWQSPSALGYWAFDARTLEVQSNEIDLPARALSGSASVHSPAFGSVSFFGMTYEERTDRLYLLMASSPQEPIALIAARANPGPGQNPVEYVRRIRSCRNRWPQEVDPTLSAGYQIPVLEVKNASGQWDLHVPCNVRDGVLGVVRVAADPPVDPATKTVATDSAESVTIGPVNVRDVLADPEGLRFIAITLSAASRVGWVYDAPSAAFVGLFRASGPGQSCSEWNCASSGVDPETGRFFGLTTELGLYWLPLRQDPVPQATTFDGFPETPDVPARQRIWYDPTRRALFALSSVSDDPGDADRAALFYDIIEIPPPPDAPEELSPDRFTVNRAEEEGVTETRYVATGSGYAVRTVLARGLYGTIPVAAGTLANEAVKAATDNACAFTDRTLTFAQVASATLSDSSAAAMAVELEADPATKVDLDTPSRCRLENPILTLLSTTLGTVGQPPPPNPMDPPVGPLLDDDDLLGKPWGYKSAECEASDDADTSETDATIDVGTAQVECQYSREKLDAEAFVEDLPVPAVQVAGGKVDVHMERVAGAGATVSVESVVRGLQVPAAGIAIAELRSELEVKAAGRPGTARASYHRSIKGIVGKDLPVVDCEDEGCEAAFRQVNNALSGRAEFRFTSPDPRLCRDLKDGVCLGSPGGAQAGVLKSVFRRESDNALSGDGSWEVPALEIMIYNDDAKHGRARQLFQFAGGRADVSYNMSLVPQGIGFPPAPPEVLTGFEPPPPLPDMAPLPPDSPPPSDGPGLVPRAMQAMVEGFRFLFTNPRAALKTMTTWLLLVSPLLAARRRRRLRLLESE